MNDIEYLTGMHMKKVRDRAIRDINASKQQMSLERVAKMFNVEIKTLRYRADGRIEWQCEHGIGHTLWCPKGSSGIHGCCGNTCCSKLRRLNG